MGGGGWAGEMSGEWRTMGGRMRAQRHNNYPLLDRERKPGEGYFHRVLKMYSPSGVQKRYPQISGAGGRDFNIRSENRAEQRIIITGIDICFWGMLFVLHLEITKMFHNLSTAHLN